MNSTIVRTCLHTVLLTVGMAHMFKHKIKDYLEFIISISYQIDLLLYVVKVHMNFAFNILKNEILIKYLQFMIFSENCLKTYDLTRSTYPQFI